MKRYKQQNGITEIILAFVGLFIIASIMDGNSSGSSNVNTFIAISGLVIGGFLYVKYHDKLNAPIRFSNRPAQLFADLAKVDAMSGVEFENYVADLLRARNYRVQMLGGSGDGGVDLVAQLGMEKYAIQVKRYSKPISRNAVSDAVAGKSLHRCTHAMVITNSYFTPKARGYTRLAKCQLANRELPTKLI